MTKILSCY